MSDSGYDFRSEVLRRAAEGHRHFALRQNFRHSEIRQTDVPGLVHQDVFRLQVSVDDILRVEVS